MQIVWLARFYSSQTSWLVKLRNFDLQGKNKLIGANCMSVKTDHYIAYNFTGDQQIPQAFSLTVRAPSVIVEMRCVFSWVQRCIINFCSIICTPRHCKRLERPAYNITTQLHKFTINIDIVVKVSVQDTRKKYLLTKQRIQALLKALWPIYRR